MQACLSRAFLLPLSLKVRILQDFDFGCHPTKQRPSIFFSLLLQKIRCSSCSSLDEWGLLSTDRNSYKAPWCVWRNDLLYCRTNQWVIHEWRARVSIAPSASNPKWPSQSMRARRSRPSQSGDAMWLFSRSMSLRKQLVAKSTFVPRHSSLVFFFIRGRVTCVRTIVSFDLAGRWLRTRHSTNHLSRLSVSSCFRRKEG